MKHVCTVFELDTAVAEVSTDEETSVKEPRRVTPATF